MSVRCHCSPSRIWCDGSTPHCVTIGVRDRIDEHQRRRDLIEGIAEAGRQARAEPRDPQVLRTDASGKWSMQPKSSYEIAQDIAADRKATRTNQCSSCGTWHSRDGQRYCHDCHARYQREWRASLPKVQTSVTLDRVMLDDATRLIQEATEIGNGTAEWLAKAILGGFLESLGITLLDMSDASPEPSQPLCDPTVSAVDYSPCLICGQHHAKGTLCPDADAVDATKQYAPNLVSVDVKHYHYSDASEFARWQRDHGDECQSIDSTQDKAKA